MNKEPSQLRRAFAILHANLSFVVIAYSLSLLYDIVTTEGLGPLVLLSLILIKIMLYGGLLGTLVEISSGQEMFPVLHNFFPNIRQFTGAFFLLSLIPILIHFCLHIFIPLAATLSASTITAHLNIIIFFFFAKHAIYQKYIKNSPVPPRPLNISWPESKVILTLYLADVTVYYLPLFIETESFHLSNILRFVSAYFHFLTFVYLVLLALKPYPEIQEKFNAPKEIFLINPLAGGIINGLVINLFYRAYPPFFVVLKALTPPNYKFREFNRIVWRDHYCKKNRLVAITCYTSNASEAYKIAKEFKKRGSKVVMGGPHVTYLPDEALEFCDSVVIGEAEGVWKNIINDYENGCLKKTYAGGAMTEYYAAVHNELMTSKPQIIKEFIETSRGCKFHCSFCTIPALNNGRVRKKPVNEVVELINKVKKKYSQIAFLDNNIYNDPSYAVELFTALKPLDIKWQSFSTIDIAKNEKTLQLAKRGGCEMLVFGYEISGDSVEKKQKGKFAMAERYINYTQTIKKAGIKVKGNFIFGFDSDDILHLLRLWWFAFRLNPNMMSISVLTPIPGSKLYYDMLKAQRIINLNWKKYAALDLVIKHPHLNNKLISFLFFPLISLIFLLTTNKLGYKLLGFISLIIIILYKTIK